MKLVNKTDYATTELKGLAVACFGALRKSEIPSEAQRTIWDALIVIVKRGRKRWSWRTGVALQKAAVMLPPEITYEEAARAFTSAFLFNVFGNEYAVFGNEYARKRAYATLVDQNIFQKLNVSPASELPLQPPPEPVVSEPIQMQRYKKTLADIEKCKEWLADNLVLRTKWTKRLTKLTQTKKRYERIFEQDKVRASRELPDDKFAARMKAQREAQRAGQESDAPGDRTGRPGPDTGAQGSQEAILADVTDERARTEIAALFRANDEADFITRFCARVRAGKPDRSEVG